MAPPKLACFMCVDLSSACTVFSDTKRSCISATRLSIISWIIVSQATVVLLQRVTEAFWSISCPASTLDGFIACCPAMLTIPVTVVVTSFKQCLPHIKPEVAPRRSPLLQISFLPPIMFHPSVGHRRRKVASHSPGQKSLEVPI